MLAIGSLLGAALGHRFQIALLRLTRLIRLSGLRTCGALSGSGGLRHGGLGLGRGARLGSRFVACLLCRGSLRRL